MLKAENLKVAPIPPLTFAVAGGECLAIEGPSGSGKTRLLRALADLDPSQGHVFLDGAERMEMPANRWRRRVRYVATETAWWTDTAREAFGQAAPASGLEALLDSLGLNAAVIDQPIARLSTGEKQLLAFARAIVDQPRALLLDEPTNGLDAHATALVEERIRRHLLSGRTVVLVSHDAAQIERLAHLRLELAPTPARRRHEVSGGAMR